MVASAPIKHGLGRPPAFVEDEPRPDIFIMLVCDGMTRQEAYRRAGFKGKSLSEPDRLWNKPHVQKAVAAIMEARSKTGPITLPRVTDMLQRVFAGALQASDFGPAHNAAFSLARLYGLVIDRATITDLRRPSRDPDAPAEQALGDWVASLPALPSPQPLPSGPATAARAQALKENQNNEARDHSLNSGDFFPSLEPTLSNSEGPGPVFQALDNIELSQGPSPERYDDTARQSENGAPAPAVTGTPSSGAFSGYKARYPEVLDLIAETDGDTPHTPTKSKRVPRQKKQVPATRGKKTQKRKLSPRQQKIPTAKQLFG